MGQSRPFTEGNQTPQQRWCAPTWPSLVAAAPYGILAVVAYLGLHPPELVAACYAAIMMTHLQFRRQE
jgi:hypothetical protein